MLNESHTVLGHTVRVLDLKHLGVDQRGLFRVLKPTFRRIPLDRQDVELLHYRPEPWRRHAVSGFVLERNKTGAWNVSKKAVAAFTQAVKDKRSTARKFPEMQASIVSNPEFRKLLVALANQARELHPSANAFRFVVHQVRTEATPSLEGHNSPEQIHQDGNDFVVPALVVNRRGISGGASEIYSPEKDNPLFQRVLKPGQLTIHPDSGPTLQTGIHHHVTGVKTLARVKKGFRDILGFDLDVIR